MKRSLIVTCITVFTRKEIKSYLQFSRRRIVVVVSWLWRRVVRWESLFWWNILRQSSLTLMTWNQFRNWYVVVKYLLLFYLPNVSVERFRVPISTWDPLLWVMSFCCNFFRSLQPNSRIIPRINPRPFPFTCHLTLLNWKHLQINQEWLKTCFILLVWLRRPPLCLVPFLICADSSACRRM